jgi:hypothetical protein
MTAPGVGEGLAAEVAGLCADWAARSGLLDGLTDARFADMAMGFAAGYLTCLKLREHGVDPADPRKTSNKDCIQP